MKPVFADTVYFAALLNGRDQYHQRAREFAALVGELVTTEFILVELADGLATSSQRGQFGRTRDALLASPGVTILPADASLFAEGVRLYTSRPDKEWSLTDCISFVVMTRLGLTEALTADHHFEQAGFVALLQ
jgi:predicted nucleic acid-binding protein